MKTRSIFTVVGTIIGAIAGSTMGLAGSVFGMFFGAVSGTVVFATIGTVIGFLVVPEVQKHKPKVRKVRLASVGLIGVIVKAMTGAIKKK